MITLDKVILAASIAIASVLGYLITSTCINERGEYERGCKNGIALSCAASVCTQDQEKQAYEMCMLHKDL